MTQDVAQMVEFVERICGGKLENLSDEELGRRMTEYQLEGLKRGLADPAVLQRLGASYRKNLRNPLFIERMCQATEVIIPDDGELN